MVSCLEATTSWINHYGYRCSGERTLLAAYRQHVGNPGAVKPSDTWSGWSHTFAWRERARAYDDHLASVRREAFERAIEEEAARQAREAAPTSF